MGLMTYKYQLTYRNLADGYPHFVNITRHNRTLRTQVSSANHPLQPHGQTRERAEGNAEALII